MRVRQKECSRRDFGGSGGDFGEFRRRSEEVKARKKREEKNAQKAVKPSVVAWTPRANRT